MNSIVTESPNQVNDITATKSLPALQILKKGKQWVCFDSNKIPYSPTTGIEAKANDSTTWGTFQEASKARKRYAGIGREFVKEQKITGVDLDKCIDKSGFIATWAQAIIDRLNSYTEISPSGRGIHIWVYGSLTSNIGSDPDGINRIEMYDCKRYFTVTGKHLPGTPTTIEERQDVLDALHSETKEQRRKAKEAKRKSATTSTTTESYTSHNGTPYGLAALEKECDAMRSTHEGGRNQQLNNSAFSIGQLIAGRELDEQYATSELYNAALQAGLDEPEINKTLNSGLSGGMAQPRTAPATSGPPRVLPTSVVADKGIPQPDTSFVLDCLSQDEWGDSLLFTHLFRGQAIYDHTENEWYLFGIHNWEVDATGRIKHLVSGQLASVYIRTGAELNIQVSKQEAEGDDQDENKARVNKLKKQITALTERAFRLRSVSRNKNVLSFAASHAGMGLTSDKWDRNAWLLAVPNGVIDLRTGICRNGKPEDYIRTTCPTEWKGLNEQAPRFEQFLQEIFADRVIDERKKLISFMQRLLGYGITGEVIEHIFAVFYGEDGRNGKDTLQNALSKTLGSASGVVHKDVLLDAGRGHSAGAATPHLSDLQGRRLAWANEPEKGARFNVSQIKELSGGGDIATRGLHEKKITKIKPSHLLLLLTNHKPHADANDSAFWARLRLITFNMRFVAKPAEQNERKIDTTLWGKLEQETSGILAWLVRGCLDWQARGLDAPESVLNDGSKYRDEEDTIRPFLDECCVCDITNLQLKVKASALYARYKTWCKDNTMDALNSTNFGLLITKKKFQKAKTNSGIVYSGLKLNVESEGLFALSEGFVHGSQELFTPIQPASEATLGHTTTNSSEQCEQFQQVFAKNESHESQNTQIAVETIHTMHYQENEDSTTQPVEPTQGTVNSMWQAPKTMHSSPEKVNSLIPAPPNRPTICHQSMAWAWNGTSWECATCLAQKNERASA